MCPLICKKKWVAKKKFNLANHSIIMISFRFQKLFLFLRLTSMYSLRSSSTGNSNRLVSLIRWNVIKSYVNRSSEKVNMGGSVFSWQYFSASLYWLWHFSHLYWLLPLRFSRKTKQLLNDSCSPDEPCTVIGKSKNSSLISYRYLFIIVV